jgi:hypothetical protein
MADDSTKKNPLDLRRERPPYVIDRSGPELEDIDAASAVGTDPTEAPDSRVEKPTVSLDPDAVRRAEREGKGFRG